jgi:hypothetical protein
LRLLFWAIYFIDWKKKVILYKLREKLLLLIYEKYFFEKYILSVLIKLNFFPTRNYPDYQTYMHFQTKGIFQWFSNYVPRHKTVPRGNWKCAKTFNSIKVMSNFLLFWTLKELIKLPQYAVIINLRITYTLRQNLYLWSQPHPCAILAKLDFLWYCAAAKF